MGECEPRNFLQPCLLLLLRERSDHGYDLVNRLRMLHAVDGDAGAVYRALRGLEKAGMVRSSWQTSEAGPARRTYQVTPLGVATLDRQADILEETHRTLHLFRDRYRVLTGEVGGGHTGDIPVGNGHAGNGHLGNGHLGNGHLGNGHLGNGHVGTGHAGNGHLENGPARNARVGDGRAGDGHPANGQAGDGKPRDDPGDGPAATGDGGRGDDHGWAHGYPGGAGFRPAPPPRERPGD
jgi:poly-beta-hydroxybutyrate-responsive repressor